MTSAGVLWHLLLICWDFIGAGLFGSGSCYCCPMEREGKVLVSEWHFALRYDVTIITNSDPGTLRIYSLGRFSEGQQYKTEPLRKTVDISISYRFPSPDSYFDFTSVQIKSSSLLCDLLFATYIKELRSLRSLRETKGYLNKIKPEYTIADWKKVFFLFPKVLKKTWAHS